MTPLSPSSEAREKDRVTLLLEINRELLLEVMRLQAAQQAEKQAEKKDDVAANTNSPDNAGDKDRSEKEKAVKSSSVSSREYYEHVSQNYAEDRMLMDIAVCAVYREILPTSPRSQIDPINPPP
jgi:hypothetical protein